jgi:hypothetical protein
MRSRIHRPQVEAGKRKCDSPRRRDGLASRWRSAAVWYVTDGWAAMRKAGGRGNNAATTEEKSCLTNDYKLPLHISEPSSQRDSHSTL